MNTSNRPVTSREYKLMLNTDRFKDREQGSQQFLRLIEFLIKKEGGVVVEKQNKEEKRRTSYLDTPEFALHQNGFALRIRQEPKVEDGFQINLKYRASDRYLSAAKDLSSSQPAKTKFEEDILPPFASKFSHSTAIETKTLPDLSNLKKLTSLFPGLKLNINLETPVKTINDFNAIEIVRKLCKFQFENLPVIKASLSFWYLNEENDWPLVGEFSFDYDIADSGADNNKLETYPTRMVEGTNGFFHALQSHSGWLNFNATTKTAFALEVL